MAYEQPVTQLQQAIGLIRTHNLHPNPEQLSKRQLVEHTSVALKIEMDRAGQIAEIISKMFSHG